MKPLGQRLVEAGLINDTQLQSALREQQKTREYLGRILIRLGYVSEEAVAAALSAQARVKYVDLGQYSPQPEALQLVQEKFAREHHLVPLSYVGKVLVVAMANPLDIITIDELRRMSKGPVEVVGATQSEVLEALDRAYGVGVGAAWNEVVEHSLRHVMGRRGAGGTETDVAQEPPVIRLVESLITRGIQEGATDIHVEPEERLVRNRFRVDGVLRQGPDVPKELQGAVIARIKVMANLDIAENRLPQDGRMDFQFGGRQIDIRVSTFPTIRGENLVLRILDRAKLVLGLEQLGFTPDHLTFFKRVLQNPNGIILVTGPTGSGKTTTLYSAMSYLNAEERNIITIEDPVEYEIQGIRQSQINVKAGLTFANGLRHILRQDPDVIMVGEMRDDETVDVAIRAALTGHLVFSTLHTNDAAGAVPRLTDMGVAPFLLASALLLVVSQRLVRSICNSCKEEAEPDPALLRRLGLQTDGGDQLKFYRGKGCDKCGNTGYRNRIGIFELLRVGPEMTPLILEKADSGSIQRAARAQGMRTMLEDGIRKALRGTTTLEEVAREALMN
ncbi:MAG: general secretory pathway protein E, type IV pilus assembly protein PilB [candidate division NC10 bacterium CSP1-5]|nr:MAG: general secretory pathway protein E, type IV pilus assembly protein PilB [candidate division NC10 bacterium CSP1-5]